MSSVSSYLPMHTEEYPFAIRRVIRDAKNLAGQQGLSEFGPDHLFKVMFDLHWADALNESNTDPDLLVDALENLFPNIGEPIPSDGVSAGTEAQAVLNQFNNSKGRRVRDLAEALYSEHSFVRRVMIENSVDEDEAEESFPFLASAELLAIGELEDDDDELLDEIASEPFEQIAALRSDRFDSLATTAIPQRIHSLRRAQARLTGLVGSFDTSNDSAATPAVAERQHHFADGFVEEAETLFAQVLTKLHELLEREDVDEGLKSSIDDIVKLVNQAIELVTASPESVEESESIRRHLLSVLGQIKGAFQLGKSAFKAGAVASAGVTSYTAGYTAFGEVSGLYATQIGDLVVKCVQ